MYNLFDNDNKNIIIRLLCIKKSRNTLPFTEYVC